MKVRCPVCQSSENVQKVGSTHYICNSNRADHRSPEKGRPQFMLIIDDDVHFPYNQIFIKRNQDEFYRTPYLKIRDAGTKEI